MDALLRQGLGRRINPRREKSPRRKRHVTPRRVLSIFEAAPGRFFSVGQLEQICKKRRLSPVFVNWACGQLIHQFKIVQRYHFSCPRFYWNLQYILLKPHVSLRTVERDILEHLCGGHEDADFFDLWRVARKSYDSYKFSLNFGCFLKRLLCEDKISYDHNTWDSFYYVTGKQALEWEIRKATPVV